MNFLKSMVRNLAYSVGVLGLLHRIRNRRTLTVFMFHRVLPSGSPEYAGAEKEFTLTVAGFGRCLDFIRAHYSVISHSAIRDHIAHGSPLPNRAGLITFDDGWRDTLIHALPELKQRGLPAILFLATEVIDLAEDRWWQDMLVEALMIPGRLETLESELRLAAESNVSRKARLRRLAAAIAEMDDAQRHEILQPYATFGTTSRQMMARCDIPALAPDIVVAGHGHTHAPLDSHTNPCHELAVSRARLQELGGDDSAMSFPHGAYDAAVLRKAHGAGFDLCYTSDPELISTVPGIDPDGTLGRIHIPENEWTCEHGMISSARLASFLFFRPVVR